MTVDATIDRRRLARYIQHTLVTADATEAEVVAHCEACIEHGFDAAVVAAPWVDAAVRRVRGTPIKVASAVAFPLGMVTTRGKVTEAVELVERGAQQLDVGASIGLLRSGNVQGFRDDLAAVVSAVSPVPIMAILELPLLTHEQRDQAVDAAIDAGAACLKNASSGAVGRATPDAIQYLRQRVGFRAQVKASGGIKTAQDVTSLLQAGADLVGTSTSIAIVDSAGGEEPRHDY